MACEKVLVARPTSADKSTLASVAGSGGLVRTSDSEISRTWFSALPRSRAEGKAADARMPWQLPRARAESE